MNDLMTFSEEGLRNTISVLSELKGNADMLKNQYLDYIEEYLVPNWTTTGGVESIKILRDFATNDIQEFINYLQNRIDNLHVVANTLPSINNA